MFLDQRDRVSNAEQLLETIGVDAEAVAGRPRTVVLNVSIPDNSWSAFNSRTSFHTVPAIQQGENVAIYQVAIWADEGKITLYKIPNNFNLGFGSTTAEYVAYRESFAVSTFSIPVTEVNGQRSSAIQSAMEAFTDVVLAREQVDILGLAFQGHGTATGFFQNFMSIEDSRDYLQHVREVLGKNIDFLDFSSNCNVGSYSFLDKYSDLARYIIASDIPAGGYLSGENSNALNSIFAQPRYNYGTIWNGASSLEQGLQGILNAHRQAWAYAGASDLRGQDQAAYVYSGSAFSAFARLLSTEMTNAGLGQSDLIATGNAAFSWEPIFARLANPTALRTALAQVFVQSANTFAITGGDPTSGLWRVVSDVMAPVQTTVAPSISGGIGGDTLNGTAAGEVMFGLEGDDQLTGLAGDDQLFGYIGDDILDGGTGNDRLFGNAGADVLIGGVGQNLLDGGSGFDIASYSTAMAGVILDLNVTTAQNTGGAGTDTLVSIEGVSGSTHADFLIGNADANLLVGNAGNDMLRGNGGNDTLDGGAGFDVTLYSGVRRQYTASSTSVSGNGEGTDTLSGIEEARFVDGVLTFDATSASAQVMRLYSATLNRTPDQGGLEANVGGLAAIGLQGLANAFVASAEFQARFGALNNQSFVEQLYQFALGRTGDPGGITNWVNALNGGMSRGQVVVGFSESAENVGRTAATLNAGLWVPDQQALIIARMYDATFDRLPDVGGLTGWVNALKAGTPLVDIAAAFAGSAEFQARYGALSNQAFVEQLYRFCLNREGDPGGIAGWVATLNAGTSRASVLAGFSESPEHIALTAASWLGGIRFAGFVGAPVEDQHLKGLDDAQILPVGLDHDGTYDPADFGLTSLFDKADDAFVLPGDPDGGLMPRVLISGADATMPVADVVLPMLDEEAASFVIPAHCIPDDPGHPMHRDMLDLAWA